MTYAFVLLAMFILYFPIRSRTNGRLNWNTTCRLHTEYRAMVG